MSPFLAPSCAAGVSLGPMRIPRARLLQLPEPEDEKLPSLPRCPGPAVRTPQQRAGRQAFPLVCGLLSLRLAGLRRNQLGAHPGSTPTQEGGGVVCRHSVFPCPLPSTVCPSPAPYLAIPLVAPSPSLHGLGAPWLILSPALGSMNGLGAPQWCEGDQIRQGGRPGPPPLPPVAPTDPVHQRTIKPRAARGALAPAAV